MKFYIAGPLFTPGERSYKENLAIAIEKLGHSTYLPHRDGGLSNGKSKDTKKFFHSDIKAIDESDAIIGVLNGNDVDSGTAFELGCGYSKGKILLGLYEDTRLAYSEIHINLMITNSVKLFDSMRKLINYCSKTYKG